MDWQINKIINKNRMRNKNRNRNLWMKQLKKQVKNKY